MITSNRKYYCVVQNVECRTFDVCSARGCQLRSGSTQPLTKDEGYAVSVNRTPKKDTAAERALKRIQAYRAKLLPTLTSYCQREDMGEMLDVCIEFLTKEISKENP